MVINTEHFTCLARAHIHIEIPQKLVHISGCDPATSLHVQTVHYCLNGVVLLVHEHAASRNHSYFPLHNFEHQFL